LRGARLFVSAWD